MKKGEKEGFMIDEFKKIKATIQGFDNKKVEQELEKMKLKKKEEDEARGMIKFKYQVIILSMSFLYLLIGVYQFYFMFKHPKFINYYDIVRNTLLLSIDLLIIINVLKKGKKYIKRSIVLILLFLVLSEVFIFIKYL